MIRRYDSIAALRQEFITLIARHGRHASPEHSGNPWYAGESQADTLRMMQLGDSRLVPQAEKIVSKLDTAVETEKRVVESVVAGGWPCVSAALAGHPRAMRRIIHEQDEAAPITILVSTNSSSAIDAETLMQRGAATLALVMALTRIRPVELHVISIRQAGRDGETILMSQINTHPLDLATACYVMTSCGFDRRVHHEIGYWLNGVTNAWPPNESYYRDLVPRLGFDPKRTLLLRWAALDDPILKNPVKWINDQISRFIQRENEEQIA